MGEKCKISIRNIRREANDELKKLLKDKEIEEDEVKKKEKLIQDYTDNQIKIIDDRVLKKEDGFFFYLIIRLLFLCLAVSAR